MTDDEHFIEGKDPVTGKVNIRFGFNSDEKKKQFLENIVDMNDKAISIKINKTTCGECAAYPCFRKLTSLYNSLLNNPAISPERRQYILKSKQEERNKRAGLCFQVIRHCRQECDYYNYDSCPAHGGYCRIDSQPVSYEQECRIPGIMRQTKE